MQTNNINKYIVGVWRPLTTLMTDDDHKEDENVTNSNAASKALEKYLNSFLINDENRHSHSQSRLNFPRIKCCGTSRSLYCTECSKLLIEKECLPSSIQKGALDLPFNLDVILSDRRLSATGFHALVLLRSSQKQQRQNLKYNMHHGADAGVDINADADNGADTDTDADADADSSEPLDSEIGVENERVRLFDTEKGDTVPPYQPLNANDVDIHDTYVLFPSDNSVPLSSVAHQIKRLVVLDCKWTKSGTQQRIPEIAHLPKVHLNNAPKESFYWRWHNAGDGMCSTLEAIYYATVEAFDSCDDQGQRQRQDGGETRKAKLDLMWLFGIQRAKTALGAKKEGKPSPFSKDGKDMQRDLRWT